MNYVPNLQRERSHMDRENGGVNRRSRVRTRRLPLSPEVLNKDVAGATLRVMQAGLSADEADFTEGNAMRREVKSRIIGIVSGYIDVGRGPLLDDKARRFIRGSGRRSGIEEKTVMSSVSDGDIIEAVDDCPSRFMTFVAAKEWLAEDGFDLETALREAMFDHERWGLMDFLAEKSGLGKSRYIAQFQDVLIDEDDVWGVLDAIRAGKKVSAVFVPAGLDLPSAFHILFGRAGVPFEGGLEKVYQDLSAAITSNSRKAAVSPRISFVFDEPERMAGDNGGAKFIDPLAHWLMFRREIDKVLEEHWTEIKGGAMSIDLYRELFGSVFSDTDVVSHIPNKNLRIYYSSCRDSNGGILSFKVFAMSSRKCTVDIDRIAPDDPRFIPWSYRVVG